MILKINIIFIILIISFVNKSNSTPKSIEIADRTYKTPNKIFNDPSSEQKIFSLNYNPISNNLSSSGVGLSFGLQRGVFGYFMGLNYIKPTWSEIRILSCSNCDYSDPINEMSSDSEILKFRSHNSKFTLTYYDVGINLSSKLQRNNSIYNMNLRISIFDGIANEDEYNTNYKLRGLSLGPQISILQSKYSNYNFNIGFTQKIAILDSDKNLKINERSLYIHWLQLELGILFLL